MTNWIKQQGFHRWAFISLAVLAAAGVLLRYMQLFPAGQLKYEYILHGHSHFAFSGWMFVSLSLLIIHQVTEKQYLRIFRRILITAIVCSFAMLISFFAEGYHAISIFFSTLFILITYWFTYVVYRRFLSYRGSGDMALLLIKWGLLFLCLSSLGPWLLGPLMASGHYEILSRDAIYFYLHFQMNGWMQLTALGLTASVYLNGIRVNANSTRFWLYVFILSAIPLFAIFTLWSKQIVWLYWLAFFAAVLHALSWFVLLKQLSKQCIRLPVMVGAALLALSLKVIFQVLICVPLLSEWVFASRDLIVGYIHLVTLGCVSPLIIDQFVRRKFLPDTRFTRVVNRMYLVLVVLYLCLLFVQPVLYILHKPIMHYHLCLLLFSVGLLLTGILYTVLCGSKYRLYGMMRG
ncbi:hypothetical protein FW774_06820 [Pedobacter sp. BS3]|uniref:hypothetical protein n=1 Tax=Pedobacter sp. BS3 TaxID=2567937 RepID=UPI0011EE3A46|nr:hypothetical protein [Pedobacter sp. BS3]TZF84689.1 hypothetical protein FW774_06820 [Pedobacter sp. BS3]